jgi:trypsin-like peptidase
MERLSQDWTDDELLREIRRRERRAGSGDRRRAAAPPAGRARDLADVPTGELVQAAKGRQRVIYGSDNRQDMYQVTKSAVRRSAAAVVALVKAADLNENGDGTFDLMTESYKDAYDLCSSEPFVSQPTGCFCSGFLVAADVVATAGHCVKNAADLATMRFVFGFRMTNATTPQTKFAAADVYAGKQLLGRQMSNDGTDWALVRLDRPVVGRKAVPVRTTGRIKNKQAVYVIGHPCGLPQKYAPDAQVRDNSAAPFFVANLDTYGGNSGSPVFNAQNNNVEGILVRGETDFVSNGECDVSLVCPSTGCRGEDVTRATVWSAKVPKAKPGRGARGKRKKG